MSESTTFTPTEKPRHTALMETVIPQMPINVGTNGYTEELLYNQTIHAVHLSDLQRATMDTWAHQNYVLRTGWGDVSYPLFLLVTFDERIEAVTPYAREKARDMNVVRPDLPTVIAVVVPNSVVGQVLKLLIWGLSQVWQTTTLHIFFDSEEALTWLKRQVDYATPHSTSL